MKDRYLENCKMNYTVKAGEILGKNWNADYLELSFELLEHDDKVKMINLFEVILKKEIKKKYVKTCHQKKNEDEDEVGEIINVDDLLNQISKNKSVSRGKSNTRKEYRYIPRC